jgi:hypothetical protein
MEGGAIVLEVAQVTSHRRKAHVGKFAHVFINAEVGQLCCDCRIKQKLL